MNSSNAIESNNKRPKRTKKSRATDDGVLYGEFAMEYLEEYFNYHENEGRNNSGCSKQKKRKNDIPSSFEKSPGFTLESNDLHIEKDHIKNVNNSSITCTPQAKPEMPTALIHRKDKPKFSHLHRLEESPRTPSKECLQLADEKGSLASTSQQEMDESSNVHKKGLSNLKVRPRWYNQAYLVFLALRKSEDYTATRKQLLSKVVELDKKFSKELGFPRAYNGKTPMNSASRILTKNEDLYFVQTKPSYSKHFVYKLAYKPGDFANAVLNYNKWNNNLIRKHWPICFSPQESNFVPTGNNQIINLCQIPKTNSISLDKDAQLDHKGEIDTILITGIVDSGNSKPQSADNSLPSTKKGIQYDDAEMPRFYSMTTLKFVGAPGNESVNSQLLCIPKHWSDIVAVKESTIPSAGNGLFAKRFIPGGVPLGFYFGVPMTEDEFDYLKDQVGLASHYSIMYRKTVLDATDGDGMPYTKINGPMFCPFHFMNDDRANLNYNMTFVDGEIVNQVICYTTKDIQAGEELFVYYGSEIDHEEWVKHPGESTPTENNKNQNTTSLLDERNESRAKDENNNIKNNKSVEDHKESKKDEKNEKNKNGEISETGLGMVNDTGDEMVPLTKNKAVIQNTLAIKSKVNNEKELLIINEMNHKKSIGISYDNHNDYDQTLEG